MKPQRIAEAGFRFCGFGSCIGIKSSCSESKPCQLKFGVWISDKKMFRSSQLLTASHSAIYTHGPPVHSHLLIKLLRSLIAYTLTYRLRLVNVIGRPNKSYRHISQRIATHIFTTYFYISQHITTYHQSIATRPAV